MADIFISYAHKDQTRALVIGKKLQEMGWSIWQDVHNLRSMGEFTDEIEEGIRKCSIFLVLYSKAYYASTYCSKEFRYAIETHQKNEACIILDDDCPWINSRFGFHYAGRTIPGYGKHSKTEEELHALCEQISNSVVFVALKTLRSSGDQSVLPPVPFGDRPKLRLRNSFEIAAQQLGQYRQNQSYEQSLALRFVKDVQAMEYDDDAPSENEIPGKNDPVALSEIVLPSKPSRIVISGNGGLGKTTAMLEYGRNLLDSQPVVYVHLPDIRFDRQSGGTQYNHIERFIFDRVCVNDDTWNYIQEVAQRVDGEGVNVTILLDGINELHSIHMAEAINEIADMAGRWKYTNLIVSTRNPAGLRATRLDTFDFYSAVPPSKDQVAEYLRTNGIVPENLNARVMNLLRNPLRLTIYVQTQPNYDYYRRMPGLNALLHKEQDTVGKIMDNYLASQLYHFLDTCETDEIRKPQICAYVLSEIAVPYIAWKAYQEDRFSISESEFRKTMRGLEGLLSELWEDYRDRRLEDLIDDFHFRDDYAWKYRDAASIMEILNLLPQIETADGEKAFVFPHQSFRDYYAARFLAADLRLHLHSKCSYQGDSELTLAERELTDDVLELLSDVMQEEKAKPYCDGTMGWQFPGKKKDSREASTYSCAEQALNFLRGRFDEQARTAVKNLMAILRYARDGHLAMCCYDRLDFSKCSLRHGMFSLWFRDQLCTSTFDGAYMNSNAFFCQAHLNYVRAVCAGPEGRLLSADMDGELLETNIAEGTVTGKWTLPEKNIRGIAWNSTSQQAAVITAHSLYLFDRKTEAFRLVLRQDQKMLHQVRFSQGEVEYSVDIYPMVWFRADGSASGMEDRPQWLSGAYAVSADGRRYWRSSLNKYLFTGVRQQNGQWDEQGGSLSEIYTPHISNCVRLRSTLTRLESDFPMTPKARERCRYICEKNVWNQLTKDPDIQAFRKKLRSYLFLDNTVPDEQTAALMAAELKMEIDGFLSEIPVITGKRFSCIALSPAEDCILAACGNVVMELDADTLKLRRRIELASTVSSVCYLENGSDDVYAAIGWSVNVSVLNREFKIVSTCHGQIPLRKQYSYHDSQGCFYVLFSDRNLRKLDKDNRVARMRTVPQGVANYFDPGNGTGLQIACPMITARWTSGERYEYETDRFYPLKNQYYRPEHIAVKGVSGQEPGRNTVYFLDRSMQIVSDDSKSLKEIRYTGGLCIFGCSFRDLKGGMTADEKEILYMNGGELQ